MVEGGNLLRRGAGKASEGGGWVAWQHRPKNK